MRLERFSIYAVLLLSVSFVFAMAAPAVAGAQRLFHDYVTTPLNDYFDAQPTGLDHAAVLSATTTVAPARARVASFEDRRQARIVGLPAMAFDLAVPRQGGLIAA